MAASLGTVPSVDVVEVDPVKLAAFDSESEFMAIAFDLLKEAASYVRVAAGTMGANPTWTRDQAALGGNMVRLAKLLSAHLDQTMQRRRETVTIISRLAFETIVNVRYLANDPSPALIGSYIRHSLRHERKLWDVIVANISARGGDVEPIEQRMLNSIERTARIAEVSLESIDPRERTPWGGKNLRDKAKAVGLDGAYDAIFGGMSHNVHSAWQDLYEYHLETDENGQFTPKFGWRVPRPQMLTALATLSLTAVRDFMLFIGGEPAVAQVRDKLRGLAERIESVDLAHENYLVTKTWPRT